MTRRGEDRGDKLDEGEWNMKELRGSSVRKGSKLIFALRYVVHEWSYRPNPTWASTKSIKSWEWQGYTPDNP